MMVLRDHITNTNKYMQSPKYRELMNVRGWKHAQRIIPPTIVSFLFRGNIPVEHGLQAQRIIPPRLLSFWFHGTHLCSTSRNNLLFWWISHFLIGSVAWPNTIATVLPSKETVMLYDGLSDFRSDLIASSMFQGSSLPCSFLTCSRTLNRCYSSIYRGTDYQRDTA